MGTKQGTQKSIPIRFTKFRIIKNLTVITSTFVLLFTAYDGLSMLQSTMNGEQGIGSVSQAVVYLTFAVSSLLLPKYTIKKIGCKMTLVVGSAMYLPYIAANAYPTWLTMMSSAVLLGIGAGILWAAQCTYFNESAGMYSDLVEDSKNAKKRAASGVRNLELFVIQNGINGKMPSKPGLLSEGIVMTHECREIYSRNARAESVKTENSESLVEDKTTEQCFTETEKKFSYEKNINNQLPEMQHSSLIAVDPSSMTHESSTVNLVNNVEKRTVSISQSLKDIVIPVSDSKVFPIESITARFFGCFGAMYYASQVWSNLISYYVLNANAEDNVTLATNRSCGALYCNFGLEAAKVDEIASSTRYLLVGITVALSVGSSLLVLIFLDPLDTRDDDEKVTFTLKNAMATFNQLKQKEQLLLVPLSMFSGMSQGFYTADFTKSYVQCAWSISYVGLVSVFFGLAGGIFSTISGCVVKYIGRIPVVLFGLTLHLCLDAFLLSWHPSASSPYLFHLTAALYGAKVGIIWSQLQAFYGLLFKGNEEAAFATYYLCSAMGWTLSFLYSDYLCTYVKIYILMTFSCLGVLGYLLADRSYRQRTKS